MHLEASGGQVRGKRAPEPDGPQGHLQAESTEEGGGSSQAKKLPEN